MLIIEVPGVELYDEERQEFTNSEGFTLELEHSLVSLSKWESIFEKPFLGTKEKTTEEVLGYIEAMILTEKIPPGVLSRMSQENFSAVDAYLDAKQTATWFTESKNQPRSREVVTSELIYYWMLTFNIPIECEAWHLNRLFTLIRICNIKNTKPTKMSRSEQAAHNRNLNAQRRAQLGTRG
jgi:hypothetical protein